jgi:hypothetical protein
MLDVEQRERISRQALRESGVIALYITILSPWRGAVFCFPPDASPSVHHQQSFAPDVQTTGETTPFQHGV